MKADETRLPPTWVKVFSWIFLIFLIIPVFAVWQIIDTGAQLGVSAFGLKLKGGQDPLGWMLAVDGVLFLAALTGLFILTKRSFAYSFGISYCIVAIGVTVPPHFLAGDWDGAASSNIALQYSLLICFIVHLIRNRERWKIQNANKAEQATPNGAPVL